VRILLIQLRRIGDLILTTPAIAALREQLPGTEITVAAVAESGAMLPAMRGWQHAIIIRGGESPAWLKVRRSCFDCVIDFTRNDRSVWLTAISGAPRRIVSHRLKHKSKLRAVFYNEFVDCAMKTMHTVDYHLALLRPLGVTEASAEPRLDLPEFAHAAAADLIARDLQNAPFAIFHPGSARPEKFWEAERWAEVIRMAAGELGLRAVLTAGNSTSEGTHLAEIRKRLRTPVMDLTGKLDLLTLAALIERASLLVTVDSAPMHLANALQTPQVILFGPTNPFHWRPRRSPAAILAGKSGTPLRDFVPEAPKSPMNQISTGAVIDAMRSMLSAPAASAV
jgi:ADP-heptose:LPS heptosyltransferase